MPGQSEILLLLPQLRDDGHATRRLWHLSSDDIKLSVAISVSICKENSGHSEILVPKWPEYGWTSRTWITWITWVNLSQLESLTSYLNGQYHAEHCDIQSGCSEVVSPSKFTRLSMLARDFVLIWSVAGMSSLSGLSVAHPWGEKRTQKSSCQGASLPARWKFSLYSCNTDVICLTAFHTTYVPELTCSRFLFGISRRSSNKCSKHLLPSTPLLHTATYCYKLLMLLLLLLLLLLHTATASAASIYRTNSYSYYLLLLSYFWVSQYLILPSPVSTPVSASATAIAATTSLGTEIVVTVCSYVWHKISVLAQRQRHRLANMGKLRPNQTAAPAAGA